MFLMAPAIGVVDNAVAVIDLAVVVAIVILLLWLFLYSLVLLLLTPFIVPFGCIEL
jgi:hypothetical protein